MKRPGFFVLWLFLTLALGAVGWIFVGSLSPAVSGEVKREVAIGSLLGLRQAMHHEDAIVRMQASFPEGGCFMVTLYALSWSNILLDAGFDEQYSSLAQEEILWALDQYEDPVVSGFFSDTQVRKGVFWLGQRNLVLARYVAAGNKGVLERSLSEEFHQNSRELEQAFLKSPTTHLDSYPGLCWPADNVTALVSICMHDTLFSTHYSEAFDRWARWTAGHCDQVCGLPAGHLDSRSGRLLQGSRGCADSWILALLPTISATDSARLYKIYKEHFLIHRFGFRVFREYLPGRKELPDVDSGPVILGAGATATGVGLAAALANGDLRTAQDIAGLARVLGLRERIRTEFGSGLRYLGGRFPIGDAFLSWAYTIPDVSEPSSTAVSPLELIRDRAPLAVILLILALMWIESGRRAFHPGCLHLLTCRLLSKSSQKSSKTQY